MAEDAAGARLQQIADELDGFERLFELRNEATREVMAGLGGMPVKPGDFMGMLRGATEELDRDPNTRFDHERLDGLLDELADSYLSGSPEPRAEILRLVHDRHGVRNHMLAYVHRAVRLVRETGDELWLMRALAGLCIEDTTVDWRDTLLVVDALRSAAIEAGLDHADHFRRVARIASPEADGDGPSTRSVLQRAARKRYRSPIDGRIREGP